jgi:hypothetical protein
MRVGIALLIPLSASILQPSESRAQGADGNRLQTFTKSDFYKGLIDRAFAVIPQTVFRKCPTLVSSGSKVTVIRPVSFGGDGFPNAGLWRQSFPISGCGNDTILNIYFSAGDGEKINTVVGVPGETRTDLTLQRDTMLYANMGASRVAKDCKSFVANNTRFEGFGVPKPPIPDPGPNAHLRPWWETWTMIGCGRTIDVPIDFVPDEKGTQIIQPGGAIER